MSPHPCPSLQFPPLSHRKGVLLALNCSGFLGRRHFGGLCLPLSLEEEGVCDDHQDGEREAWLEQLSLSQTKEGEFALSWASKPEAASVWDPGKTISHRRAKEMVQWVRSAPQQPQGPCTEPSSWMARWDPQLLRNTWVFLFFTLYVCMRAYTHTHTQHTDMGCRLEETWDGLLNG